jgi:ubiquinol-cytochrome c reductase iron-sulfur subunit
VSHDPNDVDDAGRTDMTQNSPEGTGDVAMTAPTQPAISDSTDAGSPVDPGELATIPGTTVMVSRFENPGLAPHVHRLADTDPRAAKRAERQVAAMFTLSIIGTIVFCVSYFAVGKTDTVWLPGIGTTLLQNLLLGAGLGFGLFFIGIGAVHWAKTLMPDEEIVEERHTLRSSDEVRDDAVDVMKTGAAGAGLGRRPLIKLTLGGALGLFGLPFIVALRDLGPLPGDRLSHTMWTKGARLVTDPELAPIKAADVTVGSVFHVMPEGIDKVEDVLEQRAKAAVLLMRLSPADILNDKEREWGYEGIVAYSKICTHVGCPVGLYEQQTHHLLCPCHQSTFDVTEDCKVIFGPAHRPLPQLPITVDTDGYLIATSDFHEAVGPSFPERG